MVLQNTYTWLMKFFSYEFFRFLIAGTINTLLSYVIYLLILLTQTNYQIAYFFTFIIGIVTSYYINSKFTFEEKFNLARLFQYPVVYLFQYLIGASLLWFLVVCVHLPNYIAPLLVTLFSLPLTFFLSKRVIKKGLLHK